MRVIHKLLHRIEFYHIELSSITLTTQQVVHSYTRRKDFVKKQKFYEINESHFN